MLFFTDAEFDEIYKEAVISKSFDTLLTVSRKTLMALVRGWCNRDPVLYRRQYEQDIVQEIQMKLVKTCTNGFFLRNGKENYDPNGFRKWVYTVAINTKNDFAKKVRRITFIETNTLEEGEVGSGMVVEMPKYDDETVDRLNRAFLIVINSDISTYKVLTWLVQMLIIGNYNVSKIESNDIIDQKFSTMTLDSMFDLIIAMAHRLPWLSMDEWQIAEFRSRLDKPHNDGGRMGCRKYMDFYMKKGAKSSISDWVNRINRYIEKEERENGASED